MIPMAQRALHHNFSCLKLASGALALLASYLISLRFAVFIDIHFSFALAALAALSFFFGIWELVLLAAMSVFLLNWAPAASPEMLLLLVIPVFASLCRKAFPVIEGWFGNIVLTALGIIVLYYASDPRFALQHTALIAEDIAVSVMFGTAVFAIFF